MQTANSEKTASVSPTRSGKYLLFRLDCEEYGIAVDKVREIVGRHDIAVVPNTPNFVKGVINLRGKVIPLIDLRMKFNFSPSERTDRVCTIVVQVEGSSTQMLVGVMVDEVLEVVNIGPDEIDDTPDFGSSHDHSHIVGIAKAASKVRILLDADKVLAPGEWQVCTVR